MRIRDPSKHYAIGSQALEFSDVYEFLVRRWKVVAGTTALVLVASLAAAFLLTPSYNGSAQILLETPRENVLGRDGLLSQLTLSDAVMESQLAVLTSTSVMRRVIEKERLTADPEFNPPPGLLVPAVQFVKRTLYSVLGLEQKSTPAGPFATALENLLDATSVQRVGTSNVIEATLTSLDADKAALLANTLAKSYLVDLLDARVDAAKRASGWLRDRKAALQDQLAASENKVEDFKIKHGLYETRLGSVTEQQLSELNVALINARAETAQKRSRFEQVQKLVASAGDLQTIPDIVNSSLLGDLRSKLAAVMSSEADLRTKYGDRHPDLIKTRTERGTIEGQIKAEIDRAVANLSNELEAAESREASLANSLGLASSQTGVDNKVTVQLRELERVADANRQLYQSFLSRAIVAEEETTLPTTEARIISPAVVPDSPSFPPKKLFAALGLVIGVASGIGTAILLELFKTGFVAKRQVEDLLDLPVLASVPRMLAWEKAGNGPTQLIENLNEAGLSRYTEAVRSVRFNLDLDSRTDRPLRVVQVTSALAGEGKTTLAISLARSAADAGDQVLLIDADMRARMLSRLFGQENDSGLVDVLSASADILDAIYFDQNSGIYVLPAGSKAHNPPALLASPAMARLMGYLRSSFDMVIIDSPPVAAAVDAALMTRLVDKVVLAVKWSDTAREAVSGAILELRSPDRMAGIVLTMVDDRKVPRYGRYLSLGSKVTDFADAA
jgi:polysaccharide biosynthesis transport protein